MDGGGSTTVAVRDRGKEFPQLFNSPSDKYQRAVSAVLGAVSYTEVGEARTVEAKLSGPSVLLKGGTTALRVESALDVNFHVVPVNANAMTYSVTGDIGTVSSKAYSLRHRKEKERLLLLMEMQRHLIPLEVLEAPTEITISGATGEVGPEDNVKYTAKAFDAAGRELAFPSSLVNWSATADSWNNRFFRCIEDKSIR